MRIRQLIVLSTAFLAFAIATNGREILPRNIGTWEPCDQTAPTHLPALSDNLKQKAVYAKSVLTEYGLVSTEDQNYCRDSTLIDVTLFQMKDPSGAYGAYSFFISPDLKRSELTEHSSTSADHALILDGNFLVDVRGSGVGTREADLKALVAAIQPHTQSGPLPDLWQHLPTRRFVPRSDRYILGPQTLNQLFPVALGNSLGFSQGAEAELGHYNLGGHDEIVLIADFPTPQLAAQQLNELQKQFNVNGSRPGSATPPLFARRTLTLVSLVYGAPSQADANVLLDQVQSGTQLTWDEPTFEFKEPSIQVMVVGAILGTGIICGFALVAGLAFGGFRLFIKRMLPGKVFDRGTQLQVLQLGLASKPINAEDFYASVGTTPATSTVDKNLPDRIALRIFR